MGAYLHYLHARRGWAPIGSLWPSTLPIYGHIVIVIEENKDVEQILGSRVDAPNIRELAAEGAVISAMFGEEQYSQGNYF
jgi:hypothetical protein